MDNLESSIVITKVSNGFIVRGLTAAMMGSELNDNSIVFSSRDELFKFIRKHFSNLEETKNESGNREGSRDSLWVFPD